SSSSQEATKFQVRIRVQERVNFRPGMSVTAEIATRFRTNVLTVPIASVTTRLPKEKDKKNGSKEPAATNIMAESSQSSTNACATNTIDTAKSDKKPKTAAKPIEVVF